MKKILMIATGGTIASRAGANGLTPQMTPDEVLACVPEILSFCSVDSLQLFNIDSTNITPDHWLRLADCIRQNYSAYDGFVICHGTDTMAYTAAMLSYLVQHSPKPIVLTGSQKPIDMGDTDARVNLRDSFFYAASDFSADVVIVFEGKVIAGTRAKKIRTKSYNAFDSVDFPILARIYESRIVPYIVTPKAAAPAFFDKLNPRVALLSLTPGMRGQILAAYFNCNDAVVLSGYGSGGVPEGEYYGFYDVLSAWSGKGKTLVVTTQVAHEGSDMSVYQVGRELKSRFDLLEGFALTNEAIITKLMWCMGQTNDHEKIKELFFTTVNYDRIG
ncbi:MAG: asparaginase [Clostridia bacterium]|nr:asparaginase [Clostridia bacterium]